MEAIAINFYPKSYTAFQVLGFFDVYSPPGVAFSTQRVKTPARNENRMFIFTYHVINPRASRLWVYIRRKKKVNNAEGQRNPEEPVLANDEAPNGNTSTSGLAANRSRDPAETHPPQTGQSTCRCLHLQRPPLAAGCKYRSWIFMTSSIPLLGAANERRPKVRANAYGRRWLAGAFLRST